ncbi:MAG: hypothetical protein FWB90_04090 [Fibromonadales bacterium]|nr:hypothetical protein [Fibromonadales bacterium]
MSGVRVILLASLLLVIALIFSCGEYAEIPYENRIVGEDGPAYSSSGEPDPAGPSSQSTTPSSQSVTPSSQSTTPSSQSVIPSSSSAATANAPQLIWDLSMGGAVSTGGGWFSYTDQSESGKSTTDYSCEENGCDWVDKENGKVIFNLSPSYKNCIFDDCSNGYFAYAGVGFNWNGNETAFPIPTSYTGICVDYSLSIATDVTFAMKIITVGNLYNYDDFEINMPARSSSGKALFNFSGFKQAGWGIKGNVIEAKENAMGINFQGTLKSRNSSANRTATLIFKSVNLVSNASQCN